MKTSNRIAIGLFGLCALAPRFSLAQEEADTAAAQQQAPPLMSSRQIEKVGGGFKKTTVVAGLENPWGLAFLPNGDMLITERPGRLRLVKGGQLSETPVEGVPKVFASSQGGLMDIALHPKFEQNQYVYLTYSVGEMNANHSVLARGKYADGRLNDVKVIFEARPDKPGNQHFGACIEWLPDGTMLLSIGDGGNPPLMVEGILARENGQRLDRHLGKILRLNDDGSVPKDNPFVGKGNAKPEVYTYGNRNIQGLARDRESGRVWATEHGPFGGDELNLVAKGSNYGWPVISYGLDYQTKEPVAKLKSGADKGMVDPKVVWAPSKAPSGLLVYSGQKFPQWRGSILSGGLVTLDIRRITLDGTRAMSEESLPIGRRVRDIVQGPDDLVYVLTDHKDGELFRLEPEN